MDQAKMAKLIKKNRLMLNSMTKKYHKMKTSEAGIKKLCKDALEITGWFIFPVLQGLGCYPGITDFIAIRYSRVLFIEIKSPTGKQRSDQIAFQADIEAKGGEYWLIDCYEDIEKMIGN